MCNYFDVVLDIKIVVVVYVEGIDFLMEGVKDVKNLDIDYVLLVFVLVVCGCVFEVCEIMLKNCGIDKSKFVFDVSFMLFGVVCVVWL